MDDRERLVRKVARALHRRASPRAVVAFALATSGVLGLLASILLLSVGVLHMGVRYALSFALAYAVFLLVLRAWVVRWEYPAHADLVASAPSPPRVNVDAADVATGLEPADAAGGLDEAWILVLPAALVVGAICAAGYVLSIAPVLLGEVALDVAIAAGAFRRATRIEPAHWMVGAARRTAAPALALGVALAVVGSALEAVSPGAHTIGRALAAL
ncbi:MAG: hypothetical protein R3E88_02200 [Myxococcota bacterium]